MKPQPRPIPQLTADQIESFWMRVTRKSDHECWPWLSYKNNRGYGTFRSTNTGHMYAHRIAYTLTYGPIPDGLTIDHVDARGCTMKSCCNPAHLEAVPQGENILRYLRKHVMSDTCRCGKPRYSVRERRCKDCRNAYARAYQMEWRKRQK